MTATIETMGQASAALETWDAPSIQLFTKARRGQTVQFREVPWLLKDKLEALLEGDILPIAEAALSFQALDEPNGDDLAAVVAAVLPKLKDGGKSAFEIICELTDETPASLAQLRLADISRLAGAAAKLIKDELMAGVALFSGSGMSGAPPASPPASAPTAPA